jgi:hypothetical protein
MKSYPNQNQMTFQPGDPVRLSKLGELRIRRAPSKTGKVVGKAGTTKSSQNTIRVLFDGMSYPVSMHRTYIEPLNSISADGQKATLE